ncbi:MAG: leucine-rich repeat domain-containing protein [Verrucomicrobiota bacterium]|jgi:hypothetical protein|nr:leucine-rich repeat domain-containing protein [Verrucomicrobiota bacterium]
MKQLLLICAVVALVGCWKKEAPKGGIRVKVQRSTPYQELPKAAVGKLITNPIVEEAIRKQLKKPLSKLTEADLEKLEYLKLLDNKLTDVKGLENLTQLTYLDIRSNQLTSVKGLEKLTKLTYLNLRHNKLTDVKGLKDLTQLEKLYLEFNQLTDVKGLEKLTKLTTLNLYSNPVLTKAQIAELQKALPKCKIVSNPTK